MTLRDVQARNRRLVEGALRKVEHLWHRYVTPLEDAIDERTPTPPVPTGPPGIYWGTDGPPELVMRYARVRIENAVDVAEDGTARWATHEDAPGVGYVEPDAAWPAAHTPSDIGARFTWPPQAASIDEEAFGPVQPGAVRDVVREHDEHGRVYAVSVRDREPVYGDSLAPPEFVNPGPWRRRARVLPDGDWADVPPHGPLPSPFVGHPTLVTDNEPAEGAWFGSTMLGPDVKPGPTVVFETEDGVAQRWGFSGADEPLAGGFDETHPHGRP